MDYKGVIIEESLENKDILKDVKILVISTPKLKNGKDKNLPPKKNLKSSFSLPLPAYAPLRSGRQGEAGGRGVWGESFDELRTSFRPPPYKSIRLRSGQVLGEICSNFFESTPPVGKRGLI